LYRLSSGIDLIIQSTHRGGGLDLSVNHQGMRPRYETCS